MTLKPSNASSVRRAVVAFLSVVIGGSLIAACSSDSIQASEFDQSCVTAADCVPIEEGPVTCCEETNCGANAAINAKGLSAYDAELQARAPSCAGTACPAIACAAPAVACVASKCALAAHAK